MRTHMMALSLATLVTSSAAAQDKSVTATVFKLHPAAPPAPALKYSLLPLLRDCQPGNAALFYQRAHCPDNIASLHRWPFFAKMHDWLEQPAPTDSDKEVGRILSLSGVFKDLDYAARCESCDWQLTARLRDEGVALLLPELNSFHQMAQLLAVKARLEIHEGRHDAALRTLQTGFAMGRNVADCPIVINALVGMRITMNFLREVEEFVKRPGAPNLYWALRDLPEPFIDLRRPLQGDRLAVDAWWPDVRKALSEPKFQPLPLHTLRTCVDKMTASMRGDNRVEMGTSVALVYPAALAYFRAQGHSLDELDALPVTQVVLMYSLAHWERWYDAVYRWHNVPYYQARAGLKKAAEERDQMIRANKLSMLFLQHMLPAHENTYLQRARLQRRLAGLQCIEAIRLYAAAHDGNLPELLNDIRAVPIPLDPFTGNAFEYSSDGGSARLFGPPPPGESANERNVLFYQITMAKK